MEKWTSKKKRFGVWDRDGKGGYTRGEIEEQKRCMVKITRQRNE